jgi:exosome complex RNA-binding protein Rrp42 (RNase PH superfamily)
LKLLLYAYADEQGTVAAIDPTEREEAVMGGRITYVLNVHKYVAGA